MGTADQRGGLRLSRRDPRRGHGRARLRRRRHGHRRGQGDGPPGGQATVLRARAGTPAAQARGVGAASVHQLLRGGGGVRRCPFPLRLHAPARRRVRGRRLATWTRQSSPGALVAPTVPRRREVHRAGGDRGPAGRGICALAPVGDAASWRGTPSSCARATPSRTRSVRADWSSGCPAATPPLGPRRCSGRSTPSPSRSAPRSSSVTWPPRSSRSPPPTPSWPPRSRSSTPWRSCARPRAPTSRCSPTPSATTPASAAQFLNAGLGFGGGCLPKDIRGFMARAGELGAGDALTFLREVDAINQRRRVRAVDMAAELLDRPWPGSKVAVLGAAFKPDSDDIRDSPALNVAGRLHLLRGPRDRPRPPGSGQRTAELADVELLRHRSRRVHGRSPRAGPHRVGPVPRPRSRRPQGGRGNCEHRRRTQLPRSRSMVRRPAGPTARWGDHSSPDVRCRHRRRRDAGEDCVQDVAGMVVEPADHLDVRAGVRRAG